MDKLVNKIVSLRPNEKDKAIDQRTALVDGVYMFNHPIRKKMLTHVWAKYNMLPDVLTQSLGRLYDAIEDIYVPDKNFKSLFDYTHDKSSLYSRSIAEKNLTVDNGNYQRGVTETPKEAYKSWYNTAYQGENYYDSFENYKYDSDGIINLSFSEPDNKKSYGYNMLFGDGVGYDVIKHNTESKNDKLILEKEKASKENELSRIKKPQKEEFDNDKEYKNALKKYRTDKKRKHELKQDIREIDKNIDEFIDTPKSLLTKTAKLFSENKIDSLVARFHGDIPKTSTNVNEWIDTARSKKGNSRGRNLLKKEENKINGYNNPYCRVWTFHHQYGTNKNKLIRPFYDENGNVKNIEQSELIQYFRSENGGEYLHDYSVLKNGFVKITPEYLGDLKYDTKRCMFSIENLAWKDVNVNEELERDQIGPNGGRIMWFPPYDLQFQESSQAQWNETNFIGRGEPIYTYTNTKRTGSLSFTLLIDHPSIMNIFDKKKEKDVKENNDILRFFAGCDIPMELENNITNTNKNKTQEPESVTEKTSDEGNILEFSVYFPNNYSGRYSNAEKIDEDWAEYLFWGFNALSFYETEQRGYEMKKGVGISNEYTGLFDTCVKYDSITKTVDEIEYYYRHDNDMCDRLRYSNLSDSDSFQLNSTNDNDNTISFAELFIKLNMDNEKIKEYGKNLGLLNDNYEFVNPNVKKLDNLDNCNFKITGVATSQKSRTSKELAERRAKTVENFLKTKLSPNNGVFLPNEVKTETVTDTDVNSENSKKGRRVDVEISYNLPNITTQNEINTNEEIEIEEDIDEVVVTARPPKHRESDYFKNLEYIDNFAYQTIKEKIKYFEPAYHSISPEGFNARLTFLQQCTRQGHTLERKANDTANIYSTAGNMAFGRPPFCVLRIGDFINTKILVRSLNIVYQNGNGMQWDMNPEGIGVQPMFAKVTMQIEIIGGQSLDAPVSRLNNAVSFNYYANTGVYEKRSDKAFYGSDKINHSDLYEPQRIIKVNK